MSIVAVETKFKLTERSLKRKLKCEILDFDTIEGNEQYFPTDLGNTRQIDIRGYHIRLTDTAKVVIMDALTCKHCNTHATHYAICDFEGKDSFSIAKKYQIIFFHVDCDRGIVVHTKDHIIPKSQGGIDGFDNYQNLCYTCNQTKGDTVCYDDLLRSTDTTVSTTKEQTRNLITIKYKERLTPESPYKHTHLNIDSIRSVDLYRGKIISKNSVSVVDNLRIQQLAIAEKAYFKFNRINNNIDEKLVLPWYLKPFKNVITKSVKRLLEHYTIDKHINDYQDCQKILNERNPDT